MEVLEHEEKRTVFGQQLEETADPPVELGLGDLRRGIRALRGGLDREQIRERCRDGPELVDVTRRQSAQQIRELRRRSLVFVAAQDARGLLDDLDDRPVRDPFAVGEAAAGEDLPVRRCARRDLLDEPALADPRRADEHRHRRARSRAHVFPERQHTLELRAAADERRY